MIQLWEVYEGFFHLETTTWKGVRQFHFCVCTRTMRLSFPPRIGCFNEKMIQTCKVGKETCWSWALGRRSIFQLLPADSDSMHLNKQDGPSKKIPWHLLINKKNWTPIFQHKENHHVYWNHLELVNFLRSLRSWWPTTVVIHQRIWPNVWDTAA